MEPVAFRKQTARIRHGMPLTPWNQSANIDLGHICYGSGLSMAFSFPLV